MPHARLVTGKLISYVLKGREIVFANGKQEKDLLFVIIEFELEVMYL